VTLLDLLLHPRQKLRHREALGPLGIGPVELPSHGDAGGVGVEPKLADCFGPSRCGWVTFVLFVSSMHRLAVVAPCGAQLPVLMLSTLQRGSFVPSSR